MSFIPDPKALEKRLKVQVAKLLKKSRDVLLPILQKVNNEIIVTAVTESPSCSPYFTVQLPMDIDVIPILLIEVKKIILGSGKFLLHVPNSNNEIKVSILLDNVSEFKLFSDFISPPIETSVIQKIPKSISEDEQTSHLKAIRESIDGIPVKISQKNNFKNENKMNEQEQHLKDEITALLNAMNFNPTEHYNSIMPKGFISMNNEGPVYFKKPEYALTVLKKCQKLNMSESVTSSGTSTLLFLPSFKNPLAVTSIVPQKNVKFENNLKFKSKEAFTELKVFLKILGFKMGSGCDYSTIALNTDKTFAVLNGVHEKRQEIIEAFTKHSLFNCLELKEGKKSIRVDLAFFKNPFPAPEKNNLKAPVDSIAKKITVKESPKINSEEKLADLRVFIHSSGIICGKHYAAITLNASKTLASINGVQKAGNPLRSELINKFKEYDLLECLNTTSTEKSIKVDLALFKKPTTVKFEPKQDLKKKVNQDKKDKLPLDFSEPLHKLEEIANQLHFLTKKIQFDPATIWDLIKSNFSKDNDFELLVRKKTPEGEISKLISKEELIKIFL